MKFLEAFGPLVFIFIISYLFGKQANVKEKESGKTLLPAKGSALKSRSKAKDQYHEVTNPKLQRRKPPVERTRTHAHVVEERSAQVAAGETHGYDYSINHEKNNIKATAINEHLIGEENSGTYLKNDPLNKLQITKYDREADLTYKSKPRVGVRQTGYCETEDEVVDEELMLERNCLQRAFVMKEILDKPITLRRR